VPFVISLQDAAGRIISGLERGRFEIAFPWQLVTIAKFFRLFPYRIFFALIDRGLERIRRSGSVGNSTTSDT
jgi:hypothetical protein